MLFGKHKRVVKTILIVEDEPLTAFGIEVMLAVTGYPPDNAAELAMGCLLKPYNDRKLKAALEAVDRHLAGEKVKVPAGLQLFEPSQSRSS